MSNPNRARGGYNNGRGGHHPASMNQVVANGQARGGASHANGSGRGRYPNVNSSSQVHGHNSARINSEIDVADDPAATVTPGTFRGGLRVRGYVPTRGRGAFFPRGGLRGGMRGRGRGSFSQVAS
jgi:hypothetical protein